jgi:hypothetical protein
VRTLGLAALVIVAACGKKDDGGAKQADKPAEPRPTDKPSEVKPPPPPPRTVDCDAIVTAADIATACGVDATDVEIKKGALEKGVGATACLRAARLEGKPWLQFSVNASGTDPAGVKNLIELSRNTPDAVIKDIDAGDGGVLIVKKVEATRSTSHDIEASKGALWFKLATDVPDGGKQPCSDDGLVAIAKTIASHL